MSNYYEGENGESGQPTGVMPPPPPGYQQAPGYPPPAQAGYGYEYGMQRLPARPRRLFPTETKPFYLTSEFAISLLASILIAITAASSNAFGAWRAWILITAIVVAYNISRGLAKAATRSHAPDPRDNLDLSRGHNGGHQQHQ
jgi:hypothetical protein